MRFDGIRRHFNPLMLAAALVVAGLPAWTASAQNRPTLAPASPTAPSSSERSSSVTSAANNAREEKDKPGAVVKTDQDAGPESSNYIIGSDDVLNIHVWHQTEISGPVTVRPDGQISLPLVGEIQAGGLTPPQLQNSITEKLRTFVNEPEVTVIVQQANSKRFNVMGRVIRPGSYSLASRMRVLDAIAAAGGFADFAKVTKVFVRRQTPSNGVIVLPFNYKRIIQGQNESENVELQPGDTVVVP